MKTSDVEKVLLYKIVIHGVFSYSAMHQTHYEVLNRHYKSCQEAFDAIRSRYGLTVEEVQVMRISGRYFPLNAEIKDVR